MGERDGNVRCNGAGAKASNPQGTSEAPGKCSPLMRELRTTEGYEAQSALLQPVQMSGGWLEGLMSAGKSVVGGGAGRDGSASPNKVAGRGTEARDDSKSEAGAAKEDPRGAGAGDAPIDLPNDFTQEGVLRKWIGELNRALANRVAKDRKGLKKLENLKALGWADDAGLSYDLLLAAASKSGGAQSQAGDGGGGTTTAVGAAQVLEMLAKGNGALHGIITPDYEGKCMQFSEKLMAELGAKRVDGTTNEKRGLSTKKGPLTALHRGKHVKDLPKDLPPGYQICVVSRPDWGFTEVGNHWFISAGGGYYLDNTMGVSNGAGMTASLIKATGDQWANRVFDLDKNTLRKDMATKFTDANPEFAEYRDKGRTNAQKKGKAETNPGFQAASELEVRGRAAIHRFIKGNSDYHPKVWLVEPTTKADSGQ